MGKIWDIFVGSLNGGNDSTVSSRRLITMTILGVSVLNSLAIIVLAFVVAMRPPSESATPIQALDRLIEIDIITYVTIFLLIGIITWQNINDTVGLVRGGVPANIRQAADDIQDKAGDIKDAISNLPATAPIVDQTAPVKSPSSTTA